jgi:Rrf2 family transcriptional regulator, cysteine metabolism repressor
MARSEPRRECPPPQQAEQRVLGEVNELPPDELEGPKPQLEARLGREVEDRRHDREWGKPEVGAPKRRHVHTVESEALLVITTKSPYAVRALAELARRGGSAPVPIGEIARAREIPVQFLEGLFASLRRAGILQSQRGVKGGYTFARPPEDVSVLEVVELLEGELGMEAAASGPIWTEAVEAVRNVLSGTTIATVAEREAQSAAPMYYI